MTALAISPNDGAYGVSPTSPILVIGSAPGEVFDYATLFVTIAGDEAYNASGAVRPTFSAKKVSVDDAFTLTLQPRRSFLYRVKVEVNAAIDSDLGSYTLGVVFEVREPGVALAVGALRRKFEIERDFTFPDEVAVTAVAEQLRALLGGSTSGSFAVRLVRRLYTSQLWPVVQHFFANNLTMVEKAMFAVTGDDVIVRGNVQGVLAIIEVFWDPALAQLGNRGASPALLTLLDRAFRSQNDLERLAAASALVLFAVETQVVGVEVARLIADGVF